MPTKQTNQQTSQFDPASMGAFQGLTPAWANAAKGYINSPFSNPFFQQQQQLGTRQAQGLGGTQMGNIGQNMRASGIGGGGAAPFQQEMMANQSRANSGLQAQLGFMNPVSNALGMQQNSMGMASGYRPLQTGQTQTQTTSGTGTWLPQVAGAALGGLSAGLGGGMFGGGNKNFGMPGSGSTPMPGGFGGGMGGAPSSIYGGGNMNPFFGGQPSGMSMPFGMPGFGMGGGQMPGSSMMGGGGGQNTGNMYRMG
jgi:hypothetical protein